jgi:hypothetical protein
VLVEPSIRNHKQVAISSALSNSALVSCYQKDGFALRVEGKSDTPDTSIGIEAQLLHVGVARALQRIYLRPSQEWPFLAKDCRQGHKHVLY